MKKTFILGSAGLLMFGLASCEKEKEATTSITISLDAYNLVTESASQGGEPFVAKCRYYFGLEMPQNNITIGASSLLLPGGSTSSFSTKPLPFTVSTVEVDGTGREKISFAAQSASGSGQSIENLTGMLTQAVNFPPFYNDEDYVPGYDWMYPINSLHYAYVQYVLGGDRLVRTFWPDATYTGTTVTEYPGMDAAFNSNTIQYRIILQEKDNALTGKADVVFYDAQFAPAAPAIKVILIKDLDVNFTNAGYVVSGIDKIPYIVEDGEWQEIPRFIFNAFEATVNGDLTDVQMNFKVAGVYNGIFSGSCVVK